MLLSCSVSKTATVAQYTAIGTIALGPLIIALAVYYIIYPPSEFSHGSSLSKTIFFLEISIVICFLMFCIFTGVIMTQQKAYKNNEYSQSIIDIQNAQTNLSSYSNQILSQQSIISNLKSQFNNIVSSQVAELIAFSSDEYNQSLESIISSMTTENLSDQDYINFAQQYLNITVEPCNLLLNFGNECYQKLSALNVLNSSSLSSAVVRTSSALINIQNMNSNVENINNSISLFGIAQLSPSQVLLQVLQNNNSTLQNNLLLTSNEIDWLQQLLLNNIESVSLYTLQSDLQNLNTSLQKTIQSQFGWMNSDFQTFQNLFTNITNLDAMLQMINQFSQITTMMTNYSGQTETDFQNYFSNSKIGTSKSQFLKLVNLCSQYGIQDNVYTFLTTDIQQMASTLGKSGNLQTDLQNLFAINKTSNADLQTIINICLNIDPTTNSSNVQSIFSNWLQCFSNYSLDNIASQLFKNSSGTVDPVNFFNLLYNQVDNTIYSNLTSVDNFNQLSSSYSVLLDVQNVAASLESSSYFLLVGSPGNYNSLLTIVKNSPNSRFPIFISTLQQNLSVGNDASNTFSPINTLKYLTPFNNSIVQFFGSLSLFLANPPYYVNKCQYGYKKLNSLMGGTFGFDYPNSIETAISSIETNQNPFVSVNRNSLNLTGLSNNLAAQTTIQQIQTSVNSAASNLKTSLLSSYLDSSGNVPNNMSSILNIIQAICLAKGSAPADYLTTVQNNLISIFGATNLDLTSQLNSIYSTLSSCGFTTGDPGLFIASINYFNLFQSALSPYMIVDTMGNKATPLSSCNLSVFSNQALNFISSPVSQFTTLENLMTSQFSSWYFSNYGSSVILSENQFFIIVKNILIYRCFMKTLKEVLYQASLGNFFTFYTKNPNMNIKYSTYATLNLSSLNNLIAQINITSLDPENFNFPSVLQQSLLLMDIYREFGRIYTLGKYLDSGIKTDNIQNIANAFFFGNEGLYSDNGFFNFNRLYNGYYISTAEINSLSSSSVPVTGLSFAKTLNTIGLSGVSQSDKNKIVNYSYASAQPAFSFLENIFNCPLVNLNINVNPINNNYFFLNEDDINNYISQFISSILIDETK